MGALLLDLLMAIVGAACAAWGKTSWVQGRRQIAVSIGAVLMLVALFASPGERILSIDWTPSPKPLEQEPTQERPRDRPIEDQTQRTLPEEFKDKDLPCTSFQILHGSAGGPEPDGCFAVGCSEGYALPMRYGRTWQSCTAYAHLPRTGACYHVVDRDGTQHSKSYIDGTWQTTTCD